MSSTERKSNYELLRIVSMFFIVTFHTICHGQALSLCENSTLKFILNIIVLITLVHVNSYIMVTGYFQSNSKFKQSNVWALINSNLFYRIVILIILSITGYVTMNSLEIFKETFIINFTEYWFVRVYLILYCISPFLNKLIQNLEKSEFKKLLFIVFIIFSVLPFISNNQIISNDGFTLSQFIFMYLLGAYLRIYPLKESYIFKRVNVNKFRIICIFGFFFCVFQNYLLTNTSISILGTNSIIDEIASNFINGNLSYSNPIIILQTIFYFSLFSTINIKSKFVNKIASLSLGVYLFHDNQLIKNNFRIYQFLKIGIGPIYSVKYIFHIFVAIVCIFVFGIIIEFIRQQIFKFIYNLKISKKIRDKYYKFYNTL